MRTLPRIVLAVLLLSGAAQAQVAALKATYCYGNSCTMGNGSCACIGFHNGRAYFLTAGHVLIPDQPAKVTAAIRFDNALVDVKVEVADLEPDLGVVSVPESYATAVFEVAESADGDDFDLVGVPGNDGYRIERARVSGRDRERIRFRCRSTTGFSGGPYLDSRKRVVAVHTGFIHETGERFGPNCVRIREWCRQRLGFIPVPQRTGPPGKPLPEPQPTPAPPRACNCPDCAAKFAALESRIAALEAKCSAPAPAPVKPDLSEVERRLKGLEERAQALIELQKRIDEIKFEIDKVRIAGGKTDQLEKELAAIRDMTFQVRSLAPDGKVISSETKKLGENIDLRLVPKKPAT